ncbi:MAG: TfoX/Sxy family protein [Bacteroidaceae bacterium]|nr:TfoX/Sxy family protein [Bacteroidaceae bacterium]
MASNTDFVQYVADQCAGAGDITTRKMFGDYAIYCNGQIFGLICDNRFYVKPTEGGRVLLGNVVLQKPYEVAKDYFYIADIDDCHLISDLVRVTCKELPLTKPKKKRTKQD